MSATHETSQYDEVGFTQHTNCSATCAEMLGGDCPGQGCIYAPTDEEPWHDFDPALGERKAELRGYLRGTRAHLGDYKQGIRNGFWLGVLVSLGAMLLLALIQWAGRA